MTDRRVFNTAEFLQPSDDEPVRSIVHQSDDACVIAWIVLPGQRIAPHVHPRGQDTWTVIAGEGLYQTDSAGSFETIRSGDVVVATVGDVHGVHNTGAAPLVFVSVVCPLDAGYTPLPSPTTVAAPFTSAVWLE